MLRKRRLKEPKIPMQYITQPKRARHTTIGQEILLAQNFKKIGLYCVQLKVRQPSHDSAQNFDQA